MTEAESIAAVNAEQLRQNPVFQEAVLAARAEALEDLAKVSPDDPNAIRAIQARVAAIDNLCTALRDIIIRGAAQRKPSTA